MEDLFCLAKDVLLLRALDANILHVCAYVRSYARHTVKMSPLRRRRGGEFDAAAANSTPSERTKMGSGVFLPYDRRSDALHTFSMSPSVGRSHSRPKQNRPPTFNIPDAVADPNASRRLLARLSPFYRDVIPKRDSEKC